MDRGWRIRGRRSGFRPSPGPRAHHEGRWWTRPVGWIEAGESGGDVRGFVHLRGLVPTTKGREGGLRVADYRATHRHLYAGSKDLNLGLLLEQAERAARPMDNAS